MSDTYTLTRKLVADRTKDLTDNFGNPLIDHLVNISLNSGTDEVVAMLSGIFSRVDITERELTDIGVSDKQLTQLQILTRQCGESQEDHIKFLLGYTKRTKDFTPLMIKVSDLKCSLDFSNCIKFTDDDARKASENIYALNMIRESCETEGWEV
jgi:hypothetical protein